VQNTHPIVADAACNEARPECLADGDHAVGCPKSHAVNVVVNPLLEIRVRIAVVKCKPQATGSQPGQQPEQQVGFVVV
jgi:hypothetical protein